MSYNWYRDTYLKSPRWHKIRRQRRAIDHHRCVICHGKTKLETHHWHYRYTDKNDALELASVVTVCARCHELLGQMQKLLRR